MISVDTMTKLATRVTHMNILEDQLLDALQQLKKMREEHEEIMQQIIKENRE